MPSTPSPILGQMLEAWGGGGGVLFTEGFTFPPRSKMYAKEHKWQVRKHLPEVPRLGTGQVPEFGFPMAKP